MNGRQVWKTFNRKKDAEDYLDRNSTDVRDGTYREIKKQTCGEYLKHWKETYMIPQNYKPSTLHSYLGIVEKHIRPEFEHMAMQAISPAEINSFKAKMLRSGFSPKTRPRG